MVCCTIVHCTMVNVPPQNTMVFLIWYTMVIFDKGMSDTKLCILTLKLKFLQIIVLTQMKAIVKLFVN